MVDHTRGAVRSRRWRGWLSAAVLYGLLAVCLLLVLLPFFSIVLTSFKGAPEVVKGAFQLPEAWRWDNYVKAWAQGRFSYYFGNSLVVVAPVVLASTLLSTLAGYAFGRMVFPFKRALLLLFLLGIMAPVEALIIPLYHNLRFLHMLDTYWALIMPQIGLNFAFGMFWMYLAMAAVPRDLEDAAIVDGCHSWQVFWHVMVPAVLPAVLALMVLFFVWTWNDFLLALVLISSDELRTLPLGLAFFQGRYTSNVPLTAAGAIIVAVPTLIMYILFQRQFVRGVTAGAVQG